MIYCSRKVKVVMMSYWGFVNTYGINTTDSEGNRIGTLIRFDSRADRCDWISRDNKWDGPKREVLSSKEARRIMEYCYRHTADPEDVRLGIYTMSEYVRLLPMDHLWDWYINTSEW